MECFYIGLCICDEQKYVQNRTKIFAFLSIYHKSVLHSVNSGASFTCAGSAMKQDPHYKETHINKDMFVVVISLTNFKSSVPLNHPSFSETEVLITVKWVVMLYSLASGYKHNPEIRINTPL
jgi:hypothetical protein